MVVFRSLLLFLLVFCIRETYCKPADDEQAVAPSVWSRLWGWAAYLNPWGSEVNNATQAPSMHDVNSTQIKKSLADQARQFTTITVPGKATASLKPSSEESAGNKETTTPMISVQNVQTSKTKEQESVENKVLSTSITSGENITSMLEISAIDLEGLGPISLTETGHRESHKDATTAEPAIEDLKKPKAFTTPYVSDSVNLVITEEPETEQILELDISTTPIAIYENTPTTEEAFVDKTLELNGITISIITHTENRTTEDEPIETETLTYILENTPELEASTTTTAIDKNILILKEESVTEQPEEPEVQISGEPLESESLTDVATLNTPIIIDKHNTELEPVASTIPMYVDQSIKASTEQRVTDMLKQNLTSTYELTRKQILGNKLSVSDDVLAPETTTLRHWIDQINIIITKETSTKNTLTGQTGVVLNPQLYESSIVTDLVATVSEKDEKSTEKKEAWTLSGPITSQYLGIALAATEREVESIDNRNETLILSEPFPDVANVTSEDEISAERNLQRGETSKPFTKETTEANEASVLTKAVTYLYPVEGGKLLQRNVISTEETKAVVKNEAVTYKTLVNNKTVTYLYPVGGKVLRRDEISTEETKAEIQSAAATNPYKVVEDSILKVESTNNFFEVDKAVSSGVNEISTKVSYSVNEVEGFEAISSDKDEMISAPRVLRSHSAGYRLSVCNLRYMLLLYVVYFLKV